MFKSNRKFNEEVKAAVMLLAICGSLPCQAATFNSFDTGTFNQISSISSAGTTTQVAPLPGTIVTSPIAPLAPISTSTATLAPATTVMAPIISTTPVMTQSISPVVMTPSLPVVNPALSAVATQTLLPIHSALPVFGGNLPARDGAFGNVIAPIGKGADGTNIRQSGVRNPINNISVFQSPRVENLEAGKGIGTVTLDKGNNAVQRAAHAAAGLDKITNGEIGDGAGHAVTAIARLTDDKDHRPEDNTVLPHVPGLPQIGSGLAETAAAVPSIIISVQQQSQLTLFSSTNQILQGARGQVLTGDIGTLLSQEREMIILHKGRLAVNSGQSTTLVKTSKCSVKINPSSIAIIDDQMGKPLHVIALYGKRDAVSINGPVTRGSDVYAVAGQELVVSQNDDEMIPVDGNNDAVVSGGVEVRSNVVKNDVSVADVIEQYQRRAGKLARLSNVLPSSDTTKALQSGNDVWRVFNSEKSTESPMQIVAQPGAQIEQDADGKIKLLSGMLFLSARSNGRINTPYADVDVRRNGIAMLEVDDNLGRIKSFSGPGDLQVVAGDSKFDLAPGQELLISKHNPSDVEIIPADAIARRARTQSQSIAGRHFMINDFSITSMLRYPGYRKMLAESDRSGKLCDRILKTAVVVEMVTRGRGKYEYSSIYQRQDESRQLSNAHI